MTLRTVSRPTWSRIGPSAQKWSNVTPRPSIIATDQSRSLFATHQELGDYALDVGPDPDGSQPSLLFCENETNQPRIHGEPATTPYPKDGINDHVVAGAPTVNPAGTGTKGALHYELTLGPGETREIRLRLTRGDECPAAFNLAEGGIHGILLDPDFKVWREYDITPYTLRVTSTNRPEQAIIDWILRETGYEAPTELPPVFAKFVQ